MIPAVGVYGAVLPCAEMVPGRPEGPVNLFVSGSAAVRLFRLFGVQRGKFSDGEDLAGESPSGRYDAASFVLPVYFCTAGEETLISVVFSCSGKHKLLSSFLHGYYSGSYHDGLFPGSVPYMDAKMEKSAAGAFMLSSVDRSGDSIYRFVMGEKEDERANERNSRTLE